MANITPPIGVLKVQAMCEIGDADSRRRSQLVQHPEL
jgi:hypothetical protein